MIQPLVSVIIPTYNRGTFLKQALQSVADQTYKNIEILVVDDGSSSDENQRICKQYTNVSYIKIPNSGGPAKPRNTGIRKAKGKFIAFLDDDDLWMPFKIETQVNILSENLSFGLTHSPCQVIDENGKLQDIIIGRPGTYNLKHGDVSMKMLGNWTLMMPTPLVRKSVIEQVGYFNESIPSALEDVEFWTRCSFITKFYYCDKPLALYRKHDQNISTANDKYINLPLYLKKILNNQYNQNRITKKQYNQLLNNTCQSQIKLLKQYPLKGVLKLFQLDIFWLFKKNNLKMIIYILFFK
ncbi:glycosyltransferase family 2 protein [Planktosalinus lacus]|uniref:Glycosyltransferase 2-like domain-containing protein n=1 Tax=Planktosalinus lacus TaxID=1526573 RepID=A0A8J2Y6Z9_9FLAO|nr:glycosyltransferase family A protein [Planktosalinus lacus]GGD84806.1 hypothetical protein GCM10011312_06030 [Planktosalinus lacus]